MNILVPLRVYDIGRERAARIIVLTAYPHTIVYQLVRLKYIFSDD